MYNWCLGVSSLESKDPFMFVVAPVQNGDTCRMSGPWSCSLDKLILILSFGEGSL